MLGRRFHSGLLVCTAPAYITSLSTYIDGLLRGVLPLSTHKVNVVASKRGGAGDYQINVSPFAPHSRAAHPADFAKSLASTVASSVTSLTASSSGAFVNFRFSDTWLLTRVREAFLAPLPSEMPMSSSNQLCLVDFSSPNMGKQLHVGHLRSSVIGDSLARILDALNMRVHRVSHVGDCGLPLAMVLSQFLSDPTLRECLATLLRNFKQTTPPLESNCTAYSGKELIQDPHKRAHQWIEEHVSVEALPTAEELSRSYESGKRATAGVSSLGVAGGGHVEDRATGSGDAHVVLAVLQGALAQPPDLTNTLIESVLYEWASHNASHLSPASVYLGWLLIVRASRAGYGPLLCSLGVDVPERGESVYAPFLEGTVAELLASGVAVDTQGAVGIFTHGPDQPPLLIRKSNGGYLYATTDLAALRQRLTAGYDRIVYVTDAAQVG
jgi:arginyl-tRNA synthetase